MILYRYSELWKSSCAPRRWAAISQWEGGRDEERERERERERESGVGLLY
jgi:hypothetical protein